MVRRVTLALSHLSERQSLLILLGLAFGLRLCVVLISRSVANDSAGYGFMARDFMRGQYAKGLASTLHPFYPLLISLFSAGVSSVEFTGRLISLFWGTVTLLPVYFLVKSTVDRKAATFAGLFYCLHPQLITFSGVLLSEATYWGLLTFAVYLFWTGLRRGSLLESLSSSLFLGPAYLTRPEGIGYLPVFVLWAVFYGGVTRGWVKKIILSVGLIGLFLAVSFPYLRQIHEETGQWLITKKALDTQTQYLAIDQTKQGGDRGPVEKRAVQGRKPPGMAQRLGGIATNVIRYLPFTIYHYLKAYSFTLWIFLFFGLIRRRQGGEDGRYEWFLASMIFVHVFSLATFIPSITRFSLPVIPLSLLWAGAGVLPLHRFLERRSISEPAGWIGLFIIVMVLIQLPFELRGAWKGREEQRIAGRWLKQNTPPGAVIMSNSPQEAFYAERDFVVLPPALPARRRGGPSFEDVLSLAKEKGVRYLLVNQDTTSYNRNFFESIPQSELRAVYRWDDQKKRFMTIYELAY